MEEDIMELCDSDVETTISSTTSDNGCFDCNICLQSVHEPVITLCGHIYCWPCIYKWLHNQDPQKTCPVCKADISLTLLVPLYAQGTSNSEDSESKRPHMGLEIPPRPPPLNINAILTSHPSQQLHQSPLPLPFQYHYQYHPHFSEGYGSNGLSNHGVAVMNSFFNPVTDMFREMGSTRMLVADLYAYSHDLGGYGSGNSRRMTRQEIWIVHNISVLSIFLLCFLICCLLLF